MITQIGRDATLKRDWTPRDSTRLQEFRVSPECVSPDGRFTYFIAVHNDSELDCKTATVAVYAVSDLTTAIHKQANDPPVAWRTIKLTSPSRAGVPILSRTWTGDHELTFCGFDNSGICNGYRLNLETGDLLKLTRWTEPTRDQGVHAHIAWANFVVTETPPDRYPVTAVTTDDIRRGNHGPTQKTITRLYTVPDGDIWQLTSFAVSGLAPNFSADERWMMQVREVAHGQEAGRPYFFLVDLRTRLETPIMATHYNVSQFPTIVWSADQQRVAFSHAILRETLTGSRHDLVVDSAPRHIVVLNVHSGEQTIVTAMRTGDFVADLHFGENDAEIVFRVYNRASGWRRENYIVEGGAYVLDQSISLADEAGHPDQPPKQKAALTLSIRQGENEPPAVLAEANGSELVLTNPEPIFSEVTYSPSQSFEWSASNGDGLRGGLVIPLPLIDQVRSILSGTKARVKLSPLPLVIQVYEYDPTKFQPDGPGNFTYAAQSLAARGMLVLNMDLPKARGTAELDAYVDHVSTAVSALARLGLIDTNKIGLVGFSRAGYLTYYLISHTTTFTPAAAVIDDAFTGSFCQYVEHCAVEPDAAREWDRVYNGSFWQNKTEWLRREPSFNVDQIRTPALFSLHNQLVSVAKDTIGAFALTRRPLDFLMYPDGYHELGTPVHREASQEVTVDWMSFWLNGVESDQPEKSTQYQRWRKIRSAWRLQQDWEASGNPVGSEPSENFGRTALSKKADRC